MIKKGASKDDQNSRDETPLFLAAREGNFAACKILLMNGANKDISDNMERLPRQIAEDRYRHDIVQLLDGARHPYQQPVPSTDYSAMIGTLPLKSATKAKQQQLRRSKSMQSKKSPTAQVQPMKQTPGIMAHKSPGFHSSGEPSPPSSGTTASHGAHCETPSPGSSLYSGQVLGVQQYVQPPQKQHPNLLSPYGNSLGSAASNSFSPASSHPSYRTPPPYGTPGQNPSPPNYGLSPPECPSGGSAAYLPQGGWNDPTVAVDYMMTQPYGGNYDYMEFGDAAAAAAAGQLYSGPGFVDHNNQPLQQFLNGGQTAPMGGIYQHPRFEAFPTPSPEQSWTNSPPAQTHIEAQHYSPPAQTHIEAQHYSPPNYHQAVSYQHRGRAMGPEVPPKPAFMCTNNNNVYHMDGQIGYEV